MHDCINMVNIPAKYFNDALQPLDCTNSTKRVLAAACISVVILMIVKVRYINNLFIILHKYSKPVYINEKKKKKKKKKKKNSVY